MFTKEISAVTLSNFSQVLNEQINIDQILLAEEDEVEETASVGEPRFQPVTARVAPEGRRRQGGHLRHDRRPLVGPLDGAAMPGVWVSTAMGSRGLSFAALCAELLAAHWHGEPLSLPATLAKALNTARL